MKISKKEKNLLIIVAAVAISVLYYEFVYTTLSEKISTADSERATVKADYDSKSNRIANLDKIKDDNKDKFQDLCVRTWGYYPSIIQEKIILELNSFMSSSGVKGDIVFGDEDVKTVEKISAPYIGKSNGALGELADEIKPDDNSKDNEEKKYTQGETGDSSVDCQQMQAKINFKETSPEALREFIIQVEGNHRKIIINKLESKTKEENGVVTVSGTIYLEYYGVVKLDNGDNKHENDKAYYEWILNNTRGKINPYALGNATEDYIKSTEEPAAVSEIHDFAMILNPKGNLIPRMTLGKVGDSTCKSFINSDKSDGEDVTIQINIDDKGKYYYKYQTSTQYYPQDNNGDGIEFTPAISDRITLDILCASSNDTPVNIKVINNTSVPMEVIVNNDDTSNPNVIVTGEGYCATNVTKK